MLPRNHALEGMAPWTTQKGVVNIGGWDHVSVNGDVYVD